MNKNKGNKYERYGDDAFICLGCWTPDSEECEEVASWYLHDGVHGERIVCEETKGTGIHPHLPYWDSDTERLRYR